MPLQSGEHKVHLGKQPDCKPRRWDADNKHLSASVRNNSKDTPRSPGSDRQCRRNKLQHSRIKHVEVVIMGPGRQGCRSGNRELKSKQCAFWRIFMQRLTSERRLGSFAQSGQLLQCSHRCRVRMVHEKGAFSLCERGSPGSSGTRPPEFQASNQMNRFWKLVAVRHLAVYPAL
jgi:hypothetical protein